MDPASQEALAAITLKELAALTDADIAVLRARQSYLSEADLERYASVLNPASSQAASEAEPEAQTEVKPSRKKKDDEE